MRILHLFKLDKFTQPYIEFINDNFYDNYHEFWVYGNRQVNIPLDIRKYNNVRYIRNIEKELKTKNLFKYNKIILHSLFNINIISYFAKNWLLLNRLYLYFWGGDKFPLKNKYDNFKKKFLIKHAHGIIHIIPSEENYLRKKYHPNGKFFCVQYYYEISYKYQHKLKTIPPEKKDYIAIQLGNSATQTNKHIFLLKKLEKYKNENIKIFVPLSYGDQKYANEVIKIGKELFGDKFIAVTEFMEIKEFLQFQNRMDVAIFGIKRQQAIGNIKNALNLGKKVYLWKNSIVGLHFYKELQCNVGFIDMIDNLNFEEFVYISDEERKNNQDTIEALNNNIKIRKKRWEKIFNDSV